VTPSACALWLLATVLATDFSTEPVIRIYKRVGEVQLTVVAEDAQGRPHPGLSAEEIAIRDDGRAVPKFVLQPIGDLPLRVGIVLDLSGSTAVTWEQVRQSLVESVGELVRSEDQVLVVTFTRKVELARTVHEPMELQLLLPASDTGGLTALYDSLYATCDDSTFFEKSGAVHSALILFSDGEDNLSLKGLGDAIARAQGSGIAIYTVAMHRRKAYRPGDAILAQIAERTGGRSFIVKDGAELRTALLAINQELRGGYLVSFRPNREDTAPSYHRVDVAPAVGRSLRLRTRAGYYTTP